MFHKIPRNGYLFKRKHYRISQSLIEKLIRKKKIKINSKKIQTNYRVKLNDIIEIYGIDNLKKKDQPKKFNRVECSRVEISRVESSRVEFQPSWSQPSPRSGWFPGT